MRQGWVPWDPGLLSLVTEALSTLIILWVLRGVTNMRHHGSPAPYALLLSAAITGAWSWAVIFGTGILLGAALSKESR